MPAVYAPSAPPNPHIPLVPAISLTPTTKVLKLDATKNAKAFLDSLDIIEFYLCKPKFSSGLPDGALVTTPSNLEASCLWEGQLRLAVKDGDLCFLFKNKGTLFNGCGFEMLAALTVTAYCCPDSIANAFSSLLSLFNEIQGEDEPILAFRSCFDGLILEMACCKVAIPPVLLVMLFLCALHSCYTGFIEQLRMCHHAIETTSIDMIVDDVTYHNGFTLQEPRLIPEKPGKPPPRVSVAAAAHMDTTGAVWSSPFDWLAQKYGEKEIRNRWKKALSGNGICPICHREEPKHVPKDCPLLKSLNSKLIKVSPPASPPTPAPRVAAPAAASPSPGVRNASTAPPPLGGATGSATAPSGLTAWTSDVLEDFDLDEEFRWDGHKCGADYVHCKSNKSTLLYHLCCSVAVCHVPHVNPSVDPSAFPMAAPLPLPLASDDGIISLSRHLHWLIQWVLQSSIGLSLSERFAMADTGATNHMLPDKAAFISYKAISNLQVRMGNNSFILVLGHGTAVISLNGQRVFIRNALHVPGLVVPLYSLRAHLTQRGCAFFVS
jgi:hypothetical protein